MNRIQAPEHHWPRPSKSQPDDLFRGRDYLFAARDPHDPAISAIAEKPPIRGEGAAGLQITSGFSPAERAEHLGHTNCGAHDRLV